MKLNAWYGDGRPSNKELTWVKTQKDLKALLILHSINKLSIHVDYDGEPLLDLLDWMQEKEMWPDEKPCFNSYNKQREKVFQELIDIRWSKKNDNTIKL